MFDNKSVQSIEKILSIFLISACMNALVSSPSNGNVAIADTIARSEPLPLLDRVPRQQRNQRLEQQRQQLRDRQERFREEYQQQWSQQQHQWRNQQEQRLEDLRKYRRQDRERVHQRNEIRREQKQDRQRRQLILSPR